MLIKFFSNASKSVLAKILFGGIILSFCIFGIGDIIHNYMEHKTAIAIGKYKIAADYFEREYTQKKQNIKNATNPPMSDIEFEKRNLKNVILDMVIDQAVEAETIRKLGIVVSQNSLRNIIYSLPEFQVDGVFNEQTYISLLRQAGMTEAGLLSQIRNNMARTQLFHPIVSGYCVPNFIKNYLGIVYESNKTIYLTKININEAKISEKISNKALDEFYKNNADRYKIPGKRDIAILKIDYTKFVKEINIPKSEIDHYYELHKHEFQNKETRNINRYEFESKEEAKNAYTQLELGKISNKLIANTQHLNNMHQTDFSENIGKDIFALKNKQISKIYPIGGKFYIYQVININKAKQKEENQIKQEIREILQNEKVNSPEFYTAIKDIKNKIDDSFAAGKDIDVIAKDAQAEIIELKEVEKASSINGIDNETMKEISENMFSLKEKQSSPVIESKAIDIISYVVYIRKIYNAYLPQLNKIQDKVTKDFIFEQKNKETINYLNSANSDQKIQQQMKIMKNTEKFTLSEKNCILPDNSDAKKIFNVIPRDYVLDILATINANKFQYFRLDDNTYIAVYLDKIKQSERATNDILYVLGSIYKNNLPVDIINISKQAFRKQIKIKKNEDVINERIKVNL